MSCPLCHSTSEAFKFYSQNYHGHRLLDSKSKFSVYQCQKCHTIYLKNVTVNQQYYRQYYQQNYYSANNNFVTKLYYQLFSNNNTSSILKLFSGSKKIKILDIGCGDGGFLASLPENYFIKYGADTNLTAVEICRLKGIRVKRANIATKIPFSTKFNLITLNHVFEHFSNPKSSLKNIRKILHKSGFLMITVPLSNSLGFRLGKKYWFHLDSPRHLFIPSRSGLIDYLNKQGFKVFKITRQPFQFPLDLFWSLKNYPYYWPLLIIYPFLKLPDWESATFICQKK